MHCVGQEFDSDEEIVNSPSKIPGKAESTELLEVKIDGEASSSERSPSRVLDDFPSSNSHHKTTIGNKNRLIPAEEELEQMGVNHESEQIALTPARSPTVEHSDHIVDKHKPRGPRGGFRLALLMMLVLTAHNFPEGLAVAISTVDSQHTGALICFAIAIHNIPEGIAIAVPYFEADGDRRKAVMMALLYDFYVFIQYFYGLRSCDFRGFCFVRNQ